MTTDGLRAARGPASAAEPLLIVRGLAKRFGSLEARAVFAGVEFDVDRGECVALMGESGAGKSTLLNLVAGLDRPSAGSISIGGTDIGSLDEDAAARWRREAVGFVFQAFHLLPYLTALENVLVPLRLLGWERRRAIDAAMAMLEEVDLASRATSMPAELSGGEMQRVALARALVHHPQLVLADEPTGNLDRDSAATVLALLERTARRQHAATLLVTHSSQAAAIARRVLLLTASGVTERSGAADATSAGSR